MVVGRNNASAAWRSLRGILLAELILLALAILTAGFRLRGMATSLATWGGLALLYGIWRLATSQPGDTDIAAVNAMRGQAGANPLANYASRQEYKLRELRNKRLGEEEGGAQDEDSPDAGGERPANRERLALGGLNVTIAAVLALALSWLLGRVLP